MHRLRRFAALLALPLFLQFTLAAKAIACVSRSDVVAQAGQSDTGMASMPGMDMTRNAPSDNGKHSPSPGRNPCTNPFGPGDCQPFAPCGSAVMVPNACVAAPVAWSDSHIDPLVLLAPTSRAQAPEPPPPRI